MPLSFKEILDLLMKSGNVDIILCIIHTCAVHNELVIGLCLVIGLWLCMEYYNYTKKIMYLHLSASQYFHFHVNEMVQTIIQKVGNWSLN